MLKEVIRAKHLYEINQMVDEILERARTANDERAVEIIEKYIRPVVQEHFQAAQTIVDKERQKANQELE
jgi:ferritin